MNPKQRRESKKNGARERDLEKEHRPLLEELRLRAETSLRKQQKGPKSEIVASGLAADTERSLHEMQVYQIELEMQNTELQEARDRMETLLEKYTDLYDFSPAGYFSLDGQGAILEVNLTGATMLRVERSRLIKQRMQRFVAPASQPVFLAFLEKVFTAHGKQACELALLSATGISFWASFQGTFAASASSSPGKWCRVTVSDITTLKRAQEARDRIEALTLTNRELKREIVLREAVEKALKKSEQHQSRMLEQSRHMQQQLRQLSHQILQSQEAERKRISRELHDEIAQILVGININLASLINEVPANSRLLKKKITDTQKLVEKSVDIVHRFARDLRPTLLDDLGLIPALHAYLKEFTTRTNVRIDFTAFAGVEKLSNARRTVLYRVAQSALANIAKHAQASRVKVSIQKVKNTICMEIHDDGKSFEVEKVLFAKRHQRLGLPGMRERVEMIGGCFNVESAPGQGTTICARLPFANDNKRKSPDLENHAT